MSSRKLPYPLRLSLALCFTFLMFGLIFLMFYDVDPIKIERDTFLYDNNLPQAAKKQQMVNIITSIKRVSSQFNTAKGGGGSSGAKFIIYDDKYILKNNAELWNIKDIVAIRIYATGEPCSYGITRAVSETLSGAGLWEPLDNLQGYISRDSNNRVYVLGYIEEPQQTQEIVELIAPLDCVDKVITYNVPQYSFSSVK